MFWFWALPANAGLVMLMILSPSVKNSKMVVAESLPGMLPRDETKLSETVLHIESKVMLTELEFG